MQNECADRAYLRLVTDFQMFAPVVQVMGAPTSGKGLSAFHPLPVSRFPQGTLPQRGNHGPESCLSRPRDTP